MKKFLLLMLALLFVVFCVACGGNSTNTDTSTDTDTSESVNTDTDADTDTSVPEPKKYTITWVDENGNQLNVDTVIEGEYPSYTYTKADTAEWDYTVEGWSTSNGGEALSSIPAVSDNITYYAVVTKVKQKYTVTFNSNGGSAVESQIVEYGALATLPNEPT